jgi:hypothetical protein
MSSPSSTLRKLLVTGALVTGASFGAAGIAAAATNSGSSTSSGSSATTAPSGSSSTAPAAPGGPNGTPPDPAAMNHGPGETLLTGADLQKADAAATAAVPGATIIRAETNSSGASPYEVHMTKTDGSDVTVLLDSNFNATSTISGFGPGPGPAGSQAPLGASSTSA